MNNFGVDIYQLNVGQGDSAIYIQFEGTILRTKPQRKIMSVVLVDGGDRTHSGKSSPWGNIRHTIEHIKQEYSKTDIRFDTILITHWDQDHLLGVTDFIIQDLELGKGKSQYLKYDDKDNPTTFMYFPFWTNSTSGYKITGASGKTWSQRFKMDGKVGSEEAMSWKINEGQPNETWVKKVNLVRHTPDVMLGVDFFVNNDSPVGLDYEKVTSLEKLLSMEDPSLKGKPGLLCIATDRCRLGPKKSSISEEGQEDQKLLEDPVFDEFGVMMTKLATTDANKVSVVTFVVFRDEGASTIAYYAAGDLDDEFEEEIIEWSQTSKKFTVQAIKASHHGSPGSFPQNLVSTWKPGSIIFSCGRNFSRSLLYHPAWEIIYWISQDGTYDNTSKPIFSTSYPFWLTKDSSTSNIPPKFTYEDTRKTWLASFQNDKKYTDGLKDLEKRKLPLGTALAPASYTDINTANKLLSHIAKLWDDFSTTESCSTYYTGLVNDFGTFVTEATQVWYVFIECRFGFTTVSEKRNDGTLRKTATTYTTSFTFPSTPVSTSKATSKRYLAPLSPSYWTPNDSRKRKKPGLSASETTSIIVPETALLEGPSEDVRSEGSMYSIYAKSVGDPNSYVVTVPEQRSFVEQLNRQVVELESSPVNVTVPVNFQGDDEMYLWFKNCLFTEKLLAVNKLSARGTLGNADNFDMNLTLTASDGPHQLQFSTEAIPLQFEIVALVSPLSEKWGILKNYPIMIFGLNKGGQDFEIFIADVYKLAGFDSKPRFDAKVKLMYPTSDPTTLYQRNAIWFMPSDGYSTVMRLSFKIEKMDELSNFFKPLLGNDFTVKDAGITLRRQCRYNLLQKSQWNASVSSQIVLECTVTITSIEAKITWMLSNNDEDIELLIDFGGVDLAKMLSWLKDLFGISFDISIPVEYIGNPSLRRISLTFQSDEKGTKCTSAAVIFQLLFKFGADTQEEVVFFITFSWPQKRIMGSLYPGLSNQDNFAFLYADYEPYRALRPYVDDESKLAVGLDLARIIPGGDTVMVPRHVLPTVTSANVILGADVLFFDGTLTWNPAKEAGSLPMVQLDTITLSAAHDWKSKNTELYLDVRTTLNLRPDGDPEKFPPAQINGSISYVNGKWSFGFMLGDAHLATLYSFFDQDVNEGVMDMIENVVIDILEMKYEYSPDGKSDKFTFNGTVLLGPIKASCTYTHTSSNWEFEIGVTSSDEKSTVGDVVRSLVGQDIFMPSCVDSISLSGVQAKDIFSITVKKIKNQYLIFNGAFNLGPLKFSIIQLRDTNLKATSTKRIFKIGVATLPDAEVPLIGKLPQVFDEMVFLWVDDKSANGTGFSRKEVVFINENVMEKGEPIRFKESKPQESTQKPDDLVLQKGLHFLIVVKEMGVSKVVLDHRFGDTKKAKKMSNSLLTTGKSPEGSGETTMAPMTKKIGPLSISNIGLQFLDNTLYIVLDATFELGPLEMSVFGFGLGVKLSGEFNLQKLPDSLDVKLDGLAVGFTKPPLTLAGLFRHTPPLYQGGITVGFVPYSFLAAGYYGETPYKTVFVFAKLSGPLITLSFAEIWGICGGFGYNNTIGFPTVDQVPSYPFIDNSSLSSDPLEALKSLTGPNGWVQPKEDVNWFAVGLSVKAFSLLQVSAVVAVEFDPYVKLGIFALAEATFPAKAAKSNGDDRFVYVALGIGAVIDFEAGTMKVEGQLTPNSFVLAPACHLTGGFGLFYWFGNSTLAGDWVFTIGGYHPTFVVPTHYPNPPRLGISWSVDSSISIIGESYFAITPKCCMAGGRLRATLSLGLLQAWFDAQANMLINFDPFYFQGDASVSVGVSFTLRLFIVTLYIKVEIGAKLSIRGPPFGGRVHVDFWVFGFSIDFGPNADDPVKMSLPDFWKMCLQESPNSSSASALHRRTLQALQEHEGTKSDDVQSHVIAATSGLLPASADPGIWDVRGGLFSFTIQGRFPIKTASVTGGGQVSDNTPFYSKPMRLTNAFYASTMSIDIQKEQATLSIVEDKWLLTRVVTNVPDALWGKYDQSQDPISSGNQISDLLNPSPGSITIPLTMSITVSSPKPVLACDKIPKFNFIHAMAIDVNGEGPYPNFPSYDSDIGENFKPGVPAEGVEQWNKVKNAWGTEEAKTTSQNVMESWLKVYRWGKDIKIVALPPRRALDNFLTVYMAAPLMCKA